MDTQNQYLERKLVHLILTQFFSFHFLSSFMFQFTDLPSWKPFKAFLRASQDTAFSVMCLHYVISAPFFYPSLSLSAFFPESIRRVLDKQAIKFVRAIKQDMRSGKSEDRILVRDADTHTPPQHLPPLHSSVHTGDPRELLIKWKNLSVRGFKCATEWRWLVKVKMEINRA